MRRLVGALQLRTPCVGLPLSKLPVDRLRSSHLPSDPCTCMCRRVSICVASCRVCYRQATQCNVSHNPQVGLPLSKLPVDPMFGRVLLAAAGSGCGQEAVAVVAMVSTENVFHTPRWGGSARGSAIGESAGASWP